MGARVNRGRSYARKGQVISIGIEPGIVTAKVQGTRSKPYAINIRLDLLSDKDWEKVIDVMASKAIFAAKLLSGEMPQNIEEAFGKAKTSLFPKSRKALDTDCSCPDWANPCKHIAAVYYLLAERFDEDPFLIFKLRGRTKEDIIVALREKRATTLPKEDRATSTGPALKSGDEGTPLEECLDTFWLAGEILDHFTVNPSPPKVDIAILKTLGEAPFSIGKHNIASLLEKTYHMVTDAALQKVRGESQEKKWHG